MIGLAIFVCGIVILVRGRIPYGGTKEVRGPLAYVVASLLLLPFPIFFTYGFMVGFNAEANGKQLDAEKLAKDVGMVELSVYLIVGLVSWGIVAASAQPVRRKGRRCDDDLDDDYDDDRSDGRWRRRLDDGDDERRPRRLYHDEDQDADHEHRPSGRDLDADERRPRQRYAVDDDERDDRWRRDHDDRERRRD
jgi:hypothetical protein